jgi:hypothetical protein
LALFVAIDQIWHGNLVQIVQSILIDLKAEYATINIVMKLQLAIHQPRRERRPSRTASLEFWVV